jgi:AcrR family transcriptional regulator
MPRPRFYKLDEEKQKHIIAIASEEFAAQGFKKTSFNRIIERLEISKGAMYYYFDDKADLYTTVINGVFEIVEKSIWTKEISTTSDDDYWKSIENIFLETTTLFFSDPISMTLYKGLIETKYDSSTKKTFGELVEKFHTWERQILSQGQESGIIRTDYPIDLLVHIFSAVGEAFDTWMITALPEDEITPDSVGKILQMELKLLRQIFSVQ